MSERRVDAGVDVCHMIVGLGIIVVIIVGLVSRAWVSASCVVCWLRV